MEEIVKRKPNRSRKNNISFRVSDDEKIQIEKRLAKAKMTAREFFLKCILNKKINVVDSEKLSELTRELKQEGNNLNQIARKLNQDESVSAEEIKKAQEELQEVWQSLKQYLQKQA